MKSEFIFKRAMTMLIVLCASFALAFADGETSAVFLTGTSNSAAGDFVVQSTDEPFAFQGREYEVYRVYYDNTEMNMKIAVNTEGKCNSFIAFNGEFMLFYTCNKDGFGVRKVMFSNPWASQLFDADEYQVQTVLLKKRKIDKKRAVGLIASYMPMLYG